MKKIIKITIIILLIGMGGAFLGSHFLGKYSLNNWETSSDQNLFSEQSGSTTSKEFISPDGHLKLTYTSKWIETKGELLEKFGPRETIQGYRPQTLLLASRLTQKKPSQPELLLARKGTLEKGGELEKIIEIMEEANQKRGWNMEIIKSQKKENTLEMEIKYTKPDHPSRHSKEKIFLLKKEGQTDIYTVAVVGYQKNWDQTEEEAQKIISSAQLID